MDEMNNNGNVSVFEENRPLKAKDIRRAKWANIIARCKKETKESGITIPIWCENNGISEKSYWYYHRIISSQLIAKAMNSGMITNEDLETPDFIELDPSSLRPLHSSSITITVKDVSITIDENISDSFLIRILKAASHV